MSGYSPILELGDDPHPLTPREKVARIVDPEAFDHPTVHPQHLVARRAVSFSKADAVLTALASGSGDHAGLRRLADEAADFGVPAQVDPAVLNALLAEIAALRASLTKANDGFEEYERKFYLEQDAREEAERKLAEAVGLLRDVVSPGWTRDAWSKARAFLSKEAERG